MRVITRVFLFSLFAFSSALADTAPTIPCTTLPPGVVSGFRQALNSGGYGFCIATQCQSGLENVNGKCLSSVSMNWFSLDRTIAADNLTLALYAQLNRVPQSPITVALSSSDSSASEDDYELITKTATFNGHQYSSPIYVKIKKRDGLSLPRRSIVVKLSQVEHGIAGIDQANSITIILPPQNSVPIQLTVDNAAATAGSSAAIPVHLSGNPSNGFPTYFTARLISGKVENSPISETSGKIPANSTSGFIFLPTNDRTWGDVETIRVQVTLRITGNINVVKDVSVVDIYPRPASCNSGFHVENHVCTPDVYSATYTDYFPENGVQAVCSGSEVATRFVATCTNTSENYPAINALCFDLAPIKTYKSPAGTRSCVAQNGVGAQSCSEGDSSWGACAAVSCDNGFHLSGTQCVENTFTATYSPYSVNTVQDICSGTSVGNRSVIFCMRDWDGIQTDISNCIDPTPTLQYTSQAGSRMCVLANGVGTQACAEGSTVWSSCSVTSCDPGFHLENGQCTANERSCSVPFGTGHQSYDVMLTTWSDCQTASCSVGFHQTANLCLVDTFTPTYTEYSPNPTTEICSGSALGNRSISFCQRDYDGASVSTFYCTDPSPTIPYSSPAGTRLCPVIHGVGQQSCSQGSTNWTLCEVSFCEVNFHKTDASTCSADTYTPTFSEYSENPVKDVCSGIGEINRTILVCTRDHDGALMATTFCSDPAPVIGLQSPAGSRSCLISNGTGTQSCNTGSTAWSSCALVSCDIGFHNDGSNGCVLNTQPCTIANGTGIQSWDAGNSRWGVCTVASCSQYYHSANNLCVADTFTPTFSAYSANTVNQPCMGQQNASRSITACTDDWSQQSVPVSNCTDPTPNTTYNSPAGTSTTALGVQPYCHRDNASVVATYCDVGQISATSTNNCFIASCNGGYKGWANNSWGPTQCVPASFIPPISITSLYDCWGNGDWQDIIIGGWCFDTQYNNYVQSGVYAAAYISSDASGGSAYIASQAWRNYQDGYGYIYNINRLGCGDFTITAPEGMFYDIYGNPSPQVSGAGYNTSNCPGDGGGDGGDGGGDGGDGG
jgi:hypothetical protein